MILAGLWGHYQGADSYWGYILGFGILAAAGIGFGYSAATPPAVKWFPAARTGMIAGIVVAGFGLASVYAAPLARFLLVQLGIAQTTLVLGIAFMIVIVGLAQLLVPPPKGYVPGGGSSVKVATVKRDYSVLEMCSSWQFYLLWFIYACGAGAGLMIISSLSSLSKDQAGVNLGFVFVAALAVGNGTGRIIAGTLSDKLGRKLTLFGCFVFQAILMVVLIQMQAEYKITDKSLDAARNEKVPETVLEKVATLKDREFATREKLSDELQKILPPEELPPEELKRFKEPLMKPAKIEGTLAMAFVLALLSALIGANYGANLAIFPSVTKDYYGLKNFGVNYGLVFTAWGIGGFALTRLQATLYDPDKMLYTYSCYVAAGLLVLAALVSFALRPPRETSQPE